MNSKCLVDKGTERRREKKKKKIIINQRNLLTGLLV